MQRAFSSIFFSTLPLATLSCLIPLSVKAQVTPDGTTSTTVNQDGNNFTIEQGDRIGDNLFHSFNQFSVPTLGSAAFNNAGDIANIFSRVTGSSISSIDGLISANGTANLFLINPNGIIFGENASLNLGGSFFASTADSLLFEGNTEFSASNPQAPPLLEVSIPIGANFRDNPGDINSQSAKLQAQPGQNITLLGGNITLENGLISVPNGKIELGGLTQAGAIRFNKDNTLLFPDEIARGNVSLINGAIVNVSGSGQGSIIINAENVDIKQQSIVAGGIAPNFSNVNDLVGEITINANKKVAIDNSTFVNAVPENSLGNVGDLNINADSLTLTNGTLINSLRLGTGNGGNIAFNANNILLDGSNISNAVGENAIANAGDIEITTDFLSITNGTTLNSSSLGQGNAGNINIKANNTVRIAGAGQTLPTSVNFGGVSIDQTLTNIGSQIGISGIGEGGNIKIIAERLLIEDGATINTANAGEGQAGNIKLTISGDLILQGFTPVKINNAIEFNFPSSIQSSTGVVSLLGLNSSGKAGDIEITAGSLTMKDNSIISSSTQTQGNAGNISIQTPTFVSLDNSSIESGVLPGAEGNGGNINLETRSLNLTAGAQIETLVNAEFFDTPGGIGEGGNITLNATESVNISGFRTAEAPLFNPFNPFQSQSIGLDSSGVLVSTQTGATGKAGRITVNTNTLNLADGGIIEALTANNSDGGDIEINTNTVNAINGGQILASTFGGGKAGDITIKSEGAINLTGSDSTFAQRLAQNPDVITNQGADSGIFANTTVNSTGTGGSINIFTQQFTIADNAKISVNSQGQGNGGNLSIQTDLFNLDQALVLASTVSGEGGNITLQVDDLSLMRNNSSISARAFNDANGGNLRIATNLIIAFPNGSNDIIANAQRGNGGNINITANSLFGIEERSLNFASNDINASSEFGLQGNIAINTPEVDPTSGLIELPASVGDASDQISQNPCQRGVGSEFIVTGKGGLPPNVNESLNSESAQVGLIETVTSPPQAVGGNGDKPDGMAKSTTAAQTLRPNPSTTEAVPAQGWVFNDKGEVTLTAYSTSGNKIQRSGQQQPSSCSSRIAP
jgi:filamentous hemagglutinin family protein